jgi:hypothetical protein
MLRMLYSRSQWNLLLKVYKETTEANARHRFIEQKFAAVSYEAHDDCLIQSGDDIFCGMLRGVDW